MKGLKTRKKGIGYFVMYFLLLYYIIPVGGISLAHI